MAVGHIFKGNETLVASYPVMDVLRREPHIAVIYDEHAHLELTEITRNDKLALKLTTPSRFSGRDMNHCYRYQADSVASYAIANNDCPVKAIERAKKNGHKLQFIIHLCAVITAHKRPRETYIEVEYGMVVRFEGLVATIEKDHNDNLKFVPVDFDKVRAAMPKPKPPKKLPQFNPPRKRNMQIANVTNFRQAQNIPSLLSRVAARRWMVQPMSQILADLEAAKPKVNTRIHKSHYGQAAVESSED